MPALLLLCAAQFMVILDITVVNVALPSIQRELGFGLADLQWVVTAYTLAFGGLLLLGGRAADVLGRRRVFLAGLGVFTAASLGSALSSSPETLLATRALQGVGAAMLSPAALSLVSTIFPEGPERNRALAAWAAVAAAGAAVGVLVGGILTETLGWEAIFLINLPVGLAVGLGALRTLPAGARVSGRLDLLGAPLATASLVALIYGLVEAPDAGWGSAQTLALLAGAAIGLAVFATVEQHVAAPLVRLGALRRRTTATALALLIVGMGTSVAAFFFASLYLQGVLGHSALRTGLEFLPGAVAIVIAAHLSGHLVSRHGAKPVIAVGMSLGAIGALLLSGVSPDGSFVADVLPGMLILDIGLGLSAAGVMITAMAGAGHDEAGMVSGLTTTSHELGIALVLPLLSTVAAASIGGRLDAAATLDPSAITGGFSSAFTVGAAIMAGAVVLTLLALRRDDVAPGAAPALAHH